MELTAVSARTRRENCRVDFTVVRLGENAGNPEDGEIQARFSETFRYAGYHRAALENPVALKKGDRFSVITSTTFVGEDGKRTWLVLSGTGDGVIQRAVINPGESFVKEDGSWLDWTEAEKDEASGDSNDLMKDLLRYDNFSIKAFFR